MLAGALFAGEFSLATASAEKTLFYQVAVTAALVFGVALLEEPLAAQLVLALCGVAAGIVLVNREPAVIASAVSPVR